MAIKLWWDTNITLTNTSFSCSTWPSDPAMIVALFTVVSAWNYRFEWNFTGNSAMTVALSINGTNKEMWIVIWTQNWTYDFTAEVWDVITLEASGSGSGSNLSVVRYADEIKEIYVWEWTLVDDYSAMQWPAPSGFHIPSKDEWGAIKTVWTTLWWGSSDGTNFSIALKLPMAWYRSNSSSNATSQWWTRGRYRSSTYLNSANSYYFKIEPSAIDNSNNYPAMWYSIRAFKDTPVIPTSSWTKMYWTSIEDGWIFWSSADWLISLSSDWQTWITIQDKNLWATTVWNSWDTLSEANCGKYFQWGNNYWFPRTWSVTTSWTKVDASNYWPENYYSSSTFITWTWNWSSVQNDNIRWWVTGVQQKQIWNVTEVYVGTTKIRPV